MDPTNHALVPFNPLAEVGEEWLLCQWVGQTQLEVLVSDSSEVDQNSGMGKRLRKICTEIAECQL